MRTSLRSKRDEQAFAACKEEIEDLHEQADDGLIALYYFDGAGFSLDPSIPYAWQVKNTTIELPKSSSKRINVLGFMSIDNNLESFIFPGSIDSHLLIECFNLFCATITNKTVVILDNAPIQTSDEFEESMLEWEKQGLFLKYLPPYCPELNLIEILWRKIKYEWLPFSAYFSFKSLSDSVIDILNGFGSIYKIAFA